MKFSEIKKTMTATINHWSKKVYDSLNYKNFDFDVKDIRQEILIKLFDIVKTKKIKKKKMKQYLDVCISNFCKDFFKTKIKQEMNLPEGEINNCQQIHIKNCKKYTALNSILKEGKNILEGEEYDILKDILQIIYFPSEEFKKNIIDNKNIVDALANSLQISKRKIFCIIKKVKEKLNGGEDRKDNSYFTKLRLKELGKQLKEKFEEENIMGKKNKFQIDKEVVKELELVLKGKKDIKKLSKDMKKEVSNLRDLAKKMADDLENEEISEEDVPKELENAVYILIDGDMNGDSDEEEEDEIVDLEDEDEETEEESEDSEEDEEEIDDDEEDIILDDDEEEEEEKPVKKNKEKTKKEEPKKRGRKSKKEEPAIVEEKIEKKTPPVEKKKEIPEAVSSDIEITDAANELKTVIKQGIKSAIAEAIREFADGIKK